MSPAGSSRGRPAPCPKPPDWLDDDGLVTMHGGFGFFGAAAQGSCQRLRRASPSIRWCRTSPSTALSPRRAEADWLDILGSQLAALG